MTYAILIVVNNHATLFNGRTIMMKKLFLIPFITMVFGTFYNSINCSEIEVIEHRLESINQAKIQIMQDLRHSLTVGRKAKFAAKNFLGSSYGALKLQVQIVVDCVVSSEEFINVINEVTDYQVRCICEDNIAYEDISYTPNETMIRKIDQELLAVFSEISEQVNTFFNVFYVTKVNVLGCYLLLKKLAKEEKKLKNILN